jgi:peptide methionine sulfoxide reductase MsrB
MALFPFSLSLDGYAKMRYCINSVALNFKPEEEK